MTENQIRAKILLEEMETLDGNWRQWVLLLAKAVSFLLVRYIQKD